MKWVLQGLVENIDENEKAYCIHVNKYIIIILIL